MAVGDIISDATTANSYVNFQPAAGVEAIITSVIGNSDGIIGINNGAITGYSQFVTGSKVYNSGFNTKIGVTNSVYISIYSSGDNGGYTAIQIK
jgi:hypothetical protein